MRWHTPPLSSGVVSLVAGLVIALDSAEKAFLRRSLDEPVWLAPGFQVRVTSGHDATAGLLSCASATVAATAAALLVVSQLSAGRNPRPAAIGLVVGGLLSNVVDWLGDGRVTEFIQPPGWPAFNYGDAGVAAGVVWLSWAALTTRRPQLSTAKRR